MKKRFKLISVVLSAVMALSAVPSMAEETDNVQTGAVVEKTVKPTDYAFAGKERAIGAHANRTIINTPIITREASGNTYDLFGATNRIYLYENYFYPSFEIEDAYAISDIKLNVVRHEGSSYVQTGYLVSDASLFEGAQSGEFYDTDESDLFETVKGYYSGSEPIMKNLGRCTEFDKNKLGVIDVSDDVIAELAAAEENFGKAVLNLGLRGDDAVYIRPASVCLTITYDNSKVVADFQSKLSNASTAEAVKAVAEEYSSYINADVNILSNMDYVYADIAKTTATTQYTFETFAAAIENGAKAYLKELTLTPDNYALRNWYDGTWMPGIAVNTNAIERISDGQIRELTSINLKLWEYLSAYNLDNTDAIRKMSLNTSFGEVITWLNFYATPVSSFPVSTEPAFYGTNAPEHATLVDCIKKDLVTKVNDGSVYSNTVASIDYSSKIEALNTVAGEDNSAVLLVGLSSLIGNGGGAAVNLFEDSLSVTYDMTAINDKYNDDLAFVESAADVKAVVEKYNDFIGADLGQLKNMDVVYAELFENISEGTVYSLNTLKAAIDEVASKYIYVVEYDKPTDYYIYKMNGNLDGAYNENLMLVNSDWLHVTEQNQNYDQYKKYSFATGWLDSNFIAPILSYDIYNPQAILDVKFTTSARRRREKDTYSNTADYWASVGWNVSDADLTDAKAGRYFDDTESSTDVFDTLKAWYDANKNQNWTEYKVPTAEEFLADSTTTHTTTMAIPETVMTQVQSKNAPTNLVITFSQQKRHLTAGYDCHKLTVTYDLSMANEADREFVVSGYDKYTTSEDKFSLVNDGASVELVQMKKNVPSTSKAIIAVYNEGTLVKAGTADVTAPGFMKKTVLDLTGFADVTYDELKVMTWGGLSTMKSLAGVFEIR